MDKQHRSLRIYRALLHLYPKAHREAYGDQMAQTLEDILAEQPDRLNRFIVWIRVACELPINIVEENSNNMGEISMNKLTKVSNKQLLNGVLVALVVIGYGAMGMIWHHQRLQIKSLNQYVQTVTDTQVATSGGDYTAVTIIPSENTVYMPLGKLKLEASTLNQKLVYDYQEAHTVEGIKKVFPAELNVSTHHLSTNSFSTTRQFDCSEVVYADFETKSYPMNPRWKFDGRVMLDDGRTMNVYYATSIPGCEQAWNASGINTKAIADSLLQAKSY